MLVNFLCWIGSKPSIHILVISMKDVRDSTVGFLNCGAFGIGETDRLYEGGKWSPCMNHFAVINHFMQTVMDERKVIVTENPYSHKRCIHL